MGNLRLAAIFSDHMVLQMGKQVAVFGEGTTGRQVKINVGPYEASGNVVDEHFMIYLPQMEYGGPYEMTVTDGKMTLAFEDVYVGEVFLAGGQSNMELELQNCEGGRAEAETANCDAIRMYNVLKTPVFDEDASKEERERKWKVCQPGTFMDVSAVAYYSAKKLQEKLHVAVGVIDCYQGGTSITCWMNRETLQSFPYGKQYLSAYEIKVGAKTEQEYDYEYDQFQKGVDRWNHEVTKLKKDRPNITGEEINDILGECPWNPPAGPKSLFRPCGLYETMLSRVIPYTVRGVWYYQGEEDAVRAGKYEEMLTHLIQLWRDDYNEPDLPFIIVQLPMFIEKGAKDDKQWAIIRQAQYQVYQKVEHIGMVCLLDCGEFDNIHPVDKKTVGTRLGMQTLETVFHQSVKGTSLYAAALERKDNALIVSFDKDEMIAAQGANLPYFEIAGTDGTYQEATAEIMEDNKLKVVSEEVSEPQFVRYAWVNYGEVSLFSETGLPIAPFELSF